VDCTRELVLPSGWAFDVIESTFCSCRQSIAPHHADLCTYSSGSINPYVWTLVKTLNVLLWEVSNVITNDAKSDVNSFRYRTIQHATLIQTYTIYALVCISGLYFPFNVAAVNTGKIVRSCRYLDIFVVDQSCLLFLLNPKSLISCQANDEMFFLE
jgi:hypothetical protein